MGGDVDDGRAVQWVVLDCVVDKEVVLGLHLSKKQERKLVRAVEDAVDRGLVGKDVLYRVKVEGLAGLVTDDVQQADNPRVKHSLKGRQVLLGRNEVHIIDLMRERKRSICCCCFFFSFFYLELLPTAVEDFSGTISPFGSRRKEVAHFSFLFT